MIIKNAEVFGEDNQFSVRDVCTAGGFFTAAPDETSENEETLNAGGLYLIPGLTDIHFHGCMGHDFCEGTEEAIQILADYELAHGVTQICPATMTFDEETLTKIAAAAKAHKSGHGADLVGMNMEGPFISSAKKGAQNGKFIRHPDIGMFRRLNKASGGLFKLCDIAPEEEGAMEFIDALKDETVISIAHTAADYDTAKEAMAHGAHHVTHLYNAMTGMTHRAPGVVGAAADDSITQAEIICDGIHIHPAVVRNTFKMFTDDRMILISDSMEATGLKDGEYELGGQPVTVVGNRATLHDGTIAGSATCLFDCLRTAVKKMGIPLASAIKCAAVNPAKSIGIFDTCGSITPGKKANFLLLDKDLNLVAVYKDGTLI